MDHALLVGALQPRAEVVVGAAARAERRFAIEPDRQHLLQAGLRGVVGQARQLLVQRAPRCARWRRSARPRSLRRARARRGATPRCAARSAPRRPCRSRSRSCWRAVAERLLGAALRLLELGVALLRRAEPHVELLEALLLGGAAAAELGQLLVDRGEFHGELLAPHAGLLGLLRQPQQLDLQLVRTRLRIGRFAARNRDALRRIGVGRLGAHQRTARLVGDHRLRAHLAVEVLDLLGARQQAGLLAVGRIEADRVLADRVALARHDDFAVRQVRARGQRRIEIGRGVDALEPVVQQRLEAGIAEPQQVAEARQGAMGVRDRAGRRRVERQPHRRRIGGERLHRLEPADLQRADALAQRGFERRFPAVLDVQASPQALQRIEAMLGQPRLQLAFDLHLLLQRALRREARAELGLPAGLGIDAFLAGPPRAIERSDLVAERRDARVGRSLGLSGRLEALAQVGEVREIGLGELLRLGVEALAPRLELATLLLRAAAFGGQHLDLLLHAADRAALRRRPRPARRATPLRDRAARQRRSRPAARCRPHARRRPRSGLRSSRARCGPGPGDRSIARSARSARRGAAARAGDRRRRSGCAPRGGSPRARPPPTRPARHAARRRPRSATGAALRARPRPRAARRRAPRADSRRRAPRPSRALPRARRRDASGSAAGSASARPAAATRGTGRRPRPATRACRGSH